MNLLNKNIVLLIKSPVLGGAERQALGFADYAIHTLDCSVKIIATHSGLVSKEFKQFAEEIGIDEIHYKEKYFLKLSNNISLKNLRNGIKTFLYLLKMIQFIRKFKPFLIVPFLNPPSKLAVLIYKYTGAKYTFWHQLGLDFFRKDALEAYAIKKTPIFVANAQNGIDEICDSYAVPTEKIFCLPQYTTLSYQEHDSNSIREKLQIDNDAIVIGMISHYREEKLFDLLFDTFLQLCSTRKTHLVLLGDADNSPETEKKYRELCNQASASSCSENISVLSSRPVSEILSILDIGVLVSTMEGTPNVVMEYMLYKLPVVATNHIGCKQLLNSEDFLINNTVDELTNKLDLLIEDTELRKKIGVKNANLIQKYSKENYFKRLEEIISQSNPS
ncbi:glycosyltransferase family 4 protein [Flavicella marina]|uniref:glycosyltransferase family 4 protein n=1 Tax=Flavicella marina TaxID=1475951 RepID=UPI0012641FEB|nr:glycosyltransferase family 4 protein [Flavicella marina]